MISISYILLFLWMKSVFLGGLWFANSLKLNSMWKSSGFLRVGRANHPLVVGEMYQYQKPICLSKTHVFLHLYVKNAFVFQTLFAFQKPSFTCQQHICTTSACPNFLLHLHIKRYVETKRLIHAVLYSPFCIKFMHCVIKARSRSLEWRSWHIIITKVCTYATLFWIDIWYSYRQVKLVKWLSVYV